MTCCQYIICDSVRMEVVLGGAYWILAPYFGVACGCGECWSCLVFMLKYLQGFFDIVWHIMSYGVFGVVLI